jgi:hypothetical protein
MSVLARGENECQAPVLHRQPIIIRKMWILQLIKVERCLGRIATKISYVDQSLSLGDSDNHQLPHHGWELII